jgi:uncharacterized protein DUF3237
VTELAPAFEVRVQVAAPLQVGQTPQGLQPVVPILGGTVDGRIRGRVVPGGADWQVERADGVLEAEARYELELDDGTLVSVVNRGLRRAAPDVMRRLAAGELVDPAEYYFRTTPTFRAPAGPHEWLNRSVFVGRGGRRPDSVSISVFELL